MFETNGNCGYVLKPQAMWDVNHVMYKSFNPWCRESNDVGAVCFNLQVILRLMFLGIQVHLSRNLLYLID